MDIFYNMAVLGTLFTSVLGILQFFGLLHLDVDGDIGIDPDHGDNFLNIFSIKNMAYFITLGGWSAVWAKSLNLSETAQVIFFSVGGCFAVFLNISLLYLMKKLTHKPVDTLESFIGAPATCTVSIQPHSPGLVLVTVNGRLSEYVAKSDEIINPGETCIVKLYNHNSVEVYRPKGS